MHEVIDDTAAQVVLATHRGDSIRRVAQRIHSVRCRRRDLAVDLTLEP
jgi:hypothetical protein